LDLFGINSKKICFEFLKICYKAMTVVNPRKG
jgi:hypothetical protein